MKVLGISCGRRLGNTEILVKAALMGAEQAGAEVELIRLHDLNIKPCTGCTTCLQDFFEGSGRARCVIKDDDVPFVEEALMQCDGLVLGSPIYEKTPTGQLKCLNDRLGARLDQAFRMAAKRAFAERGITTGKGPDERSFKPRVASLIAVGGSEWDTLALPTMQFFTLSPQIKVVDQILVNWIGLAKVVLLHDEHLERAHRSGRHVAETLKKPLEEAEYIGEPGLCPVCHSKVVEARSGAAYPVICGVCGVRGTLSVEDGQVKFGVTDEDRVRSHVLLSGKFEHLDEIMNVTMKPPANMGEIPAKLARYKTYLSYSKPAR